MDGVCLVRSKEVFQSSPSLGAGSNHSIIDNCGKEDEVSILSQLRCWEQRTVILVTLIVILFQSSPSLGAGSNTDLQIPPLNGTAKGFFANLVIQGGDQRRNRDR